ncbi:MULTISPECIES: hypothetical protein [unclassified Flavobacterium]|jgi:hypothetical protein|uniref:hypothetical protein n=1 Tax=unclassified Flavobacterium TaxID=196869 RepID=UPI00057DB294|nr:MULTISPECIES: hypothetical protein [unclassified Flavobacterium]KIA98332.1 hypothetical protein OA88_20705 [Flavobacterium sp. JRM]KIA99763.1 hypothetical protein OA93_02760 [Flavobacterium sp. KMS]MEA9413048.1 hypothetical protein [Flavobacterium sp. PL02]
MRKIYRYEKLSFSAPVDEDINFEIKFISDGNIGHTVINIPGDNDSEIANSGKSSLGKIQTLTAEKTICVSDIANPIPHEDTIAIEYYINKKLLAKHSNLKSDTDRPYVILTIKFSVK